MNSVVLIGNACAEPELKYTQAGTAVCAFSIAVNEKYKTKSGELREDAMFLTCEFWGRQAEIAAEYIKKGDRFAVQGSLRLDTWEKDGKKHSRHKLRVENMQLLSSRRSGGGEGGERSEGGERRNSTPPRGGQPQQQERPLYNDDDIPF